MIINIQNEKELKDETKNCKVLIDVWADWCTPCQRMAPILEDLDSDLKSRGTEGTEIKILKMNIDNGEFIEVLNKIQIRSVPTFLIYENDKVIDTLIGALPKKNFTNLFLKTFLN